MQIKNQFKMGSIPFVVLFWAFYLGLKLPVGVVLPFILLVIATVLYLFL